VTQRVTIEYSVTAVVTSTRCEIHSWSSDYRMYE